MTRSTGDIWKLAYAAREGFPDDADPRTNLKALALVSLAQIDEDNSAIHAYEGSLGLVKCVSANLGEFLAPIVDFGARFAETGSSSHGEIASLSLDFSRRLLNLLGMFRSLLDHTETSLSRDFGESSDFLSIWKQATASEYDAHPEYRIIYGLRNFCQHVGMPQLMIEAKAEAANPAVTLRIDLDRDRLLEQRSIWNNQLRADLEAAPARIPLVDTLDVWSRSFWNVARVLLNIRRTAAAEHARRIVRYRTQYDLPPTEGEVCAVRITPGATASDPVEVKIVQIDEALAREILDPPEWLGSTTGEQA